MDPICKAADDRVANAVEAADLDAFAKVDWELRKKMQAEVAALRKDAERYRWLRQRHDVLCRMYTAQGLGLDLSAVYVRSAEQLDGVIDAAMAPRPVLGAA
jgi:hypothetical protein